jgi:N-acetylglucosamine-6-phosphate deacetylase
MAPLALVNCTIYTGTAVLPAAARLAVLIDEGHITAIVPCDQLEPSVPRRDLQGFALAPALVDVQVSTRQAPAEMVSTGLS